MMIVKLSNTPTMIKIKDHTVRRKSFVINDDKCGYDDNSSRSSDNSKLERIHIRFFQSHKNTSDCSAFGLQGLSKWRNGDWQSSWEPPYPCLGPTIQHADGWLWLCFVTHLLMGKRTTGWTGISSISLFELRIPATHRFESFASPCWFPCYQPFTSIHQLINR